MVRAYCYRLLTLVALCQTVIACLHAGTPRSADVPPQHLLFSNETPDHVTVYLAIADMRPVRLGDVDGFRTASLAWPHFPPGHRARLFAVPVGTSYAVRASLADLERRGWSTTSESMEDIVAMQWTLIGQQLHATPPPPTRR